MLLGFGGRNCWCFKDWMQIDLSLGEGVPSDVSMGLPACTAMCFKGANASGKTNALKVYSLFLEDENLFHTLGLLAFMKAILEILTQKILNIFRFMKNLSV